MKYLIAITSFVLCACEKPNVTYLSNFNTQQVISVVEQGKTLFFAFDKVSPLRFSPLNYNPRIDAEYDGGISGIGYRYFVEFKQDSVLFYIDRGRLEMSGKCSKCKIINLNKSPDNLPNDIVHRNRKDEFQRLIRGANLSRNDTGNIHVVTNVNH